MVGHGVRSTGARRAWASTAYTPPALWAGGALRFAVQPQPASWLAGWLAAGPPPQGPTMSPHPRCTSALRCRLGSTRRHRCSTETAQHCSSLDQYSWWRPSEVGTTWLPSRAGGLRQCKFKSCLLPCGGFFWNCHCYWHWCCYCRCCCCHTCLLTNLHQSPGGPAPAEQESPPRQQQECQQSKPQQQQQLHDLHGSILPRLADTQHEYIIARVRSCCQTES
jgi:hypothetical protein